MIDKCFNNEVGEAFFSYMLTINLINFNAQKNMPETSGKMDVLVDRLDIAYQFIKKRFILKHKPLICLLSELYTSFDEFCSTKDKKGITKIQFNNKLKEVGIFCKQSHGQLKFKTSIEELNAIAKKLKWIHETDEYHNLNNVSDVNDDDKEENKAGYTKFVNPLYDVKWYQDMVKKPEKEIIKKPEKKIIKKKEEDEVDSDEEFVLRHLL